MNLSESHSAGKNPFDWLHMTPLLEEIESQQMVYHSQSLTVRPAVVDPLCRLDGFASELIYQILDDVPVFILRLLISCRKPGTNSHRCVLSHPQYRAAFYSHIKLTPARNLSALLYEIANFFTPFASRFGAFPRKSQGTSIHKERHHLLSDVPDDRAWFSREHLVRKNPKDTPFNA